MRGPALDSSRTVQHGRVLSVWMGGRVTEHNIKSTPLIAPDALNGSAKSLQEWLFPILLSST